MKTPAVTALLASLSFALGSCGTTGASSAESIAAELGDHVSFYASFDGTTDADYARGDGSLYTANGVRNADNIRKGLHDDKVELAPGKGRFGGALDFTAKKRWVTYYQADENMGYDRSSWSGAISMWLQLDPATDLEPGFCDPIQITDESFKDASIWVDFTKENPRQFRLGVIGDLAAWNPSDVPIDDNADFERRLIPMETPPFSRAAWSHVLINFDDLNGASGQAELFVDGESQGSVAVDDPFTWDPAKARIYLGFAYVGLMDELAVFDRALLPGEVEALFRGVSVRQLLDLR